MTEGALRGFEATSARYAGLAAHLSAQEPAAIDAEVARWEGLAQYYGVAEK
jgi:hypothetical protein